MPSDEAVLATFATAVLIGTGGRWVCTAEEWAQAVEHESTLLLQRIDGGFIEILLVPKAEARA